jgi:hypothetical protein
MLDRILSALLLATMVVLPPAFVGIGGAVAHREGCVRVPDNETGGRSHARPRQARLRVLPRPLPEYLAYRDLADDVRYKLITARMLLRHTAGLANWRRLEDDQRLRIHFQPGSSFASESPFFPNTNFLHWRRPPRTSTGASNSPMAWDGSVPDAYAALLRDLLEDRWNPIEWDGFEAARDERP